MRWLLALVLVGCADDLPCNDAPLSGTVMCTPIDGVWRLEASDVRERCGATLFSNPVTIRSRGSQLQGMVGGSRLVGVNYASGAFRLDHRFGDFWFHGEHRVVDGEPQLVGGMVYGGPGQTCDALWDFIARRE